MDLPTEIIFDRFLLMDTSNIQQLAYNRNVIMIHHYQTSLMFMMLNNSQYQPNMSN